MGGLSERCGEPWRRVPGVQRWLQWTGAISAARTPYLVNVHLHSLHDDPSFLPLAPSNEVRLGVLQGQSAQGAVR